MSFNFWKLKMARCVTKKIVEIDNYQIITETPLQSFPQCLRISMERLHTVRDRLTKFSHFNKEFREQRALLFRLDNIEWNLFNKKILNMRFYVCSKNKFFRTLIKEFFIKKILLLSWNLITKRTGHTESKQFNVEFQQKWRIVYRLRIFIYFSQHVNTFKIETRET